MSGAFLQWLAALGACVLAFFAAALVGNIFPAFVAAVMIVVFLFFIQPKDLE